MTYSKLKRRVKNFWDEQSCGEVYASGGTEFDYYHSHAKARYELEPYIWDFAKFHEGRDKDVLEIGVGMGADFFEWSKSQPRTLCGFDMSPRAVRHTRRRLELHGVKAKLFVGDAENTPLADECFDIVYSWGVLHHSPDTAQAIRQVYRILRSEGIARIMMYHKYSLTGYMLWARYGAATGRPFRRLDDIYASHLESPGTKAYSISEARMLFRDFSDVDVRIQLSFGDLLYGSVGQRHGGALLSIAKKLWPRFLLKRVFASHGLVMLIEARKS